MSENERKIKGLSESERLSSAYNRIIVPNQFLLISGFESEMFTHIAQRTLRFGKYQEVMSVKSFRTGVLNAGIPGITFYTDSWLRRCRSLLRDRGLIFYEMNFRSPVSYAVNVPGIYRALAPIYYLWDVSNGVRPYMEILRGSISIFESMGLPTDVDVVAEKEGEIVKIEDAIKAAKIKSVKASGKKKAKRVLTANNLRSVMVGYCEEVGATYHDFGWTGKELGSAKQFIKQCERTGQDPKTILFDVCKYWGSFRSGKMQSVDGKQIVLPVSVSFWKFYQYRLEIASYIGTQGMEDDTKRSRLDEAFGKRRIEKL